MKHLRLFKDREEFNAADLEYPTLSLIQEDNSTVIDETPPTIIAKYVFEEDIPKGTPCFYSEVIPGGMCGSGIGVVRSFTSFEVNGEEMIINNPIINLGSIAPTASSLDPLSFSEDSFLPAETTYAEIKFSKPVTYLGVYIEAGEPMVVPISECQQQFPQLITIYSDDFIRFNCTYFLELVGLGQVRMVLFSADSETPESIEEINSYTPIINSYSGGISLDANLRSWPAGEYTVKMEFDRRDWKQFNYFFDHCTGLREIYCNGNFIKGIFSEGFCRFAENLKTVVISSNNFIEELGKDFFRGCCGLTTVILPKSAMSIGNLTFYGCNSLTSINIPESVISIGTQAFEGCNSLTDITIPKSSQLTSIGVSAFRFCSSLTSINIPKGVTSMGDDAFWGCSSLTSITVAEDNAIYDSRETCNAIIETSSNTLIYGSSTTVIPESVTKIGKKAFYNCSGLTAINIPKGMTIFEYHAFYGCSGLTSINIPGSMTSIKNFAFNGCTSLKELFVADSSETLSLGYNSYPYNYTGKGLFYDCPLETIYLGRNLSYDNDYQYGYSPFYDQKTLTSVTIGKSVTSIGEWAFKDCRSLTTITIPENSQLTSIGGSAFRFCSSLASIILPESVTSIGNNAFNGCSSLASIILPERVTSIRVNTFYGCSSLTFITIPQSVTSIENSAFEGCNNLNTIICYATVPPTVGTYNTFTGVDKSIPVYVPASSIDAYKAANYWKEFTNFQAIS